MSSPIRSHVYEWKIERPICRRWGADRDRLGRGVLQWNSFRRRNREYVPQLSGADLEGWDLSSADLRGADLRGAHLTGAKLRGANLRGADLRRARLIDADLTSADLEKANLRHAELRGSLLLGAKLEGANLAETILDPLRWEKALLALWHQATTGRRQNLVEALLSRSALHTKWKSDTSACPEAILSDRGLETDDFMLAWSTYAIGEEQILRLLTSNPRWKTVAAGWHGEC
jgi:hypothetical protein